MSHHLAIAEESHHISSHWKADPSDEWFEVDEDAVSISARALNVTWGNDSRFWQWVDLSKDESCSSFKVGIELIQVNWLEVTGRLDLTKLRLLSGIIYEVFYVIKFKVDAFGCDSCPIKFEVITAEGEKFSRSETLEGYRKRYEEWHEVFVGQFSLQQNTQSVVEFKMFETETARWKGGMVLGGVKLRPQLHTEN